MTLLAYSLGVLLGFLLGTVMERFKNLGENK